MAVTAEGKNAAKEYLNSVGKSVSKPGSPVRLSKFSDETTTIKPNGVKLQEVYEKYNINPETFSYDDFEKWAKNHNFEYRLSGNDYSGRSYKWLPKQASGLRFWENLTTDEEEEDKEVLEQLAKNNQRKKISKTDKGAMSAAARNVIDSATFGIASAVGDALTKREYEEAGLNPLSFVGYRQANAKTEEVHPGASAVGSIAGSLLPLGALSKGVNAVTKTIPWIAKAPAWVQSAINNGITFAVQSGTETATSGGDLKTSLQNAGINFVGGAAGGALSSAVSNVAEKLLFDKGWQHKLIPEIVRNGLSSATFAGAQTGSTYFLYPEDLRPSAEEIAENIGTAFAFGAVSSALDTIKSTSQNKKYLDDLYQKMSSDYERMARANITNKDDTMGIRRFARNVIKYSDAMESYLTGKEYNATIDGQTYSFQPKKVRIVGQDKYVKSIVNELKTIRNSANSYLNSAKSGKASKTSGISAPNNALGTAVTHTQTVPQTTESVLSSSGNLAEGINNTWKRNKVKNYSQENLAQYAFNFISDPNKAIDGNFVQQFAREYVTALENSGSVAYSRLLAQTNEPVTYLMNYVMGGEEKNALGEVFKSTLTETALLSAEQKGRLYNSSALGTILNEQAQAIRSGDFQTALQIADGIATKGGTDFARTAEAAAEPRNAGATAVQETAAAGSAATATETTTAQTTQPVQPTAETTQRTSVSPAAENLQDVPVQTNTPQEAQNTAQNAESVSGMNTPVEMQTAAQTGENAANTPLSSSATAEPRFSATETGAQPVNANAQSTAAVQENTPDTEVTLRTTSNNSAGVNTPQNRTVDISNAQQNSNANSVDITSSARPKSNVGEMVNRIHSSYDPTVSKRETTRAINDIYSTLQKGFDTNATAEQQDAYIKEANFKALELGRNIVDNSRITEAVSNNEGYDELKKELRTTSISISDEDKSDINGSGGFNEFRKKYFGKLRISNNGVPVDTYYSELSASYPELFPSDITHPGDRLQRIAEVQGMLYSEPKRREMSSEEYNESVLDIAATIISEAGRYIDIPMGGGGQNKEAAGIQKQNKGTGADNHSEAMKKIIAEYDSAVDTDMLDFIDYARQKPNSNVSYELSDVSERLSSDIKRLTGIDTSGFGNAITSTNIRHIDKRHGANGESDHSMADTNDIARIQYVIDNYDHIEVLEDVSKEYRDKNQRPAPMVKMSKRIDGTYYVVEAVPDTKKHQLAVVSAYKNKAVEQQTVDVQAPTSNVRNASPDTAFIDNSISQDNTVVNRNDMQKEKNNARETESAPLQTRENGDTINKNTENKRIQAQNNETAKPDVRGSNEAGAKSEASRKSQEVADYVKNKLEKGEKISANELFAETSKAFGGKMADGTLTAKDAYDAMELGVNQYILNMDDVNLQSMLDLMEKLPTQTKRTSGTDKFQQFSTPPSLAYLANYAANVNSDDVMLEPSAGIGGIAVFAKRDGAEVHANELDKRRLEVLKNMPFDAFYNENAEQINNILGDELQPTVVVMNPPFSSSAARNMKGTAIGAKHIEEALKMLAPNGRLVAITGRGMTDRAAAFKNWWKDVKSKYNVVANFGIDGKNYRKYGTTFDVQLMVIDNNGPTKSTMTGTFENLADLQSRLEEIRNGREEIGRPDDVRRNRPERADSTSKAPDRNGAKKHGAAEQGRSESAREKAVGRSGRNSGREVPVSVAGSADDTRSVHTGQPEMEPGAERQDRRTMDIQSGSTADNTSGAEPDTGGVLRERERGERGYAAPDENAGRPTVADSGVSDGESSDVRDVRLNQGKKKKTKLDDSVYEEYVSHKLKVKGAKPHPARISESAAMSAIEPPPITYKPDLPQDIIDKGTLSNVQLEAVSYAGQSHKQTLPNGNTRGFFLGDGTGVGKGRTITGIILDNYRQGHKKAVWLSMNKSLANDTKRDVAALFGDPHLVMEYEGGKKSEKSLGKNEGILFATYSTLAKGFENDGSNFKKIVDWLGKDFDGVIVFDEAHKMGNASDQKGKRGKKSASQTGLAGIALQEALPKAKVVYSSATGATEVSNLRYAERLGLWGEGTAFKNGDDFVSQITSGGLAAMELVARDMKAMGVYLSRNISYDDVQYERLEHKLNKDQKEIYDTVADAWQIVLQNVNKALEATNQTKDGKARGSAMSAFWSGEQRFFNQILTSMQIPSVITDIEKQLADGKSVVIQLVSTNEAAQEADIARVKNEGLGLEDVDITPRQILMDFVDKSFPVEQYETYKDDNGNERSRKVLDSSGKPVLNRDAVKLRDELLDKLGSIKVPSSPLDMIIDHFGVDMVAESTGRTRRVVTRNGKKVLENISNKRDADVDAFQNGDKRIIIFSKAGGTGKSYHADRAAKNQQQRVHYLLEAGWKADDAVQGFGRSHRSNQASAPIFKLVTTDLSGQKRFISTIARRLGQLGALTKGQSQTGGQGMFSAEDNLENAIAADTLAGFYKSLSLGTVDGVKDGMGVIEKMGLKDKLFDEHGNFNLKAEDARDVPKFLNRILALDFNEQNAVFDGYAEALRANTELAAQNGTLDRGLENYKADKIKLIDEQDVNTDKLTGAKTKYYRLETQHKITPVEYGGINQKDKKFVGFVENKRTGAIRAAFKSSTTTDATGKVYNTYRLVGPARTQYVRQDSLMNNWAKAADAKTKWDKAVEELPAYRKETLNLIGGAVLPVWGKLPKDNTRIYRVLTDDGNMIIGRVLQPSKVDETLRRLGAARTAQKNDLTDAIKQIKAGGTVTLDNGWRITKSRVSNENRIEIRGPLMADLNTLKNMGVFTERIAYTTRFFIPYDTNTAEVLGRIVNSYPITDIKGGDAYSRTSPQSKGTRQAANWRTETDETLTKETPSKDFGKLKSIGDVKKYLSEKFNIPISSGKINSSSIEGVFKQRPEAIRTKISNDLPTVAHELGHYLDKKYNLAGSENIDDAMSAVSGDFLNQYKEKERPGEAVAEFVRMYLQNRSNAENSARDFYNDFVNTLSKEDLDVLNTAARWVNQYMSTNDFGKRVSAGVVTRKEASRTGIGEKISRAKHEWQYRIVDSYTSIRETTDFVQKTQSLSGEKNAYKIATNSRNAAAVANYVLTEGMTDLDGNINQGKSFIAAIKDIKKNEVKDFNNYLILRHSLEWLEPKKGAKAKRVFADETLQDTKEIRKEISKLENQHGNFKKAAANLYEYQRNLIKNFAVRSGAMDKKTAERLFEMYPDYVPFFRAVGRKKGQKTTFANQKLPIMRAKGSGEDIIVPLESIVQNTDRFVKFAMRNRVMQTLADYADTVDGFGQFMERVPPDMVPKTIQVGDYKKKIQEALENSGKLSGEGIFEVTNALDEILGDELTGYTPITNANKKIVSVLRNGKAEYYQIHDKGLYEAVAEMTPQELNIILRFSQKVMRPMKALITSFNPVFAVTNPMRDINTAFKNSVINNPAEFAKNYARAVKDIITKSDDYKMYRALGGGHASELSADLDKIQRALLDIAIQDKGIAARAAYAIYRHPIATLSKFSDFTETIPRFAEFKAVRARGGDVQDAIYAADDITTNFKRTGKTGRGLNAAFMFNNAAVQSLSKLYRSFKEGTSAERWARVAKYLAEGVITSVLMALVNHRSEEAEEAYDNLSQYTKNNYDVYYLSDGKFLKVPKARESDVLKTLIQRITDELMGDKKAFYQFGEYLADTILPPMIPTGDSVVDVIHSAAGETVLGGITDVAFNKNYMGVPIESTRYQYLPKNQRYSPRTSKLAVALGNSWFGKTTDLSPLQIDYIISDYTGYIGQLNEAWAPEDSSETDFGFGFKNKFIADSLYSEDKTDIAYDERDRAKENYDFDPTPTNAMKYEKNALRTSYISEMQKAINSLPVKEQRNGKAYLLDVLDKSSVALDKADNAIINSMKGYEGTDIAYYMTELPASRLEKTEDGVKYTYQLTPEEYTTYVKDVMNAVDKGRGLVSRSKNKDQDAKAERMKTAISDAKKAVKKQYVNKYRRKMKASGE